MEQSGLARGASAGAGIAAQLDQRAAAGAIARPFAIRLEPVQPEVTLVKGADRVEVVDGQRHAPNREGVAGSVIGKLSLRCVAEHMAQSRCGD